MDKRWGFEKGSRRQRGGGRSKRGMFCAFLLGRVPWRSQREMLMGTVDNSSHKSEAKKMIWEESGGWLRKVIELHIDVL